MHIKIHSHAIVFHIIFNIFHNLKKISHFMNVKFTFGCEENISLFRRHFSLKLITYFQDKPEYFFKKYPHFCPNLAPASVKKNPLPFSIYFFLIFGVLKP